MDTFSQDLAASHFLLFAVLHTRKCSLCLLHEPLAMRGGLDTDRRRKTRKTRQDVHGHCMCLCATLWSSSLLYCTHCNLKSTLKTDPLLWRRLAVMLTCAFPTSPLGKTSPEYLANWTSENACSTCIIAIQLQVDVNGAHQKVVMNAALPAICCCPTLHPLKSPHGQYRQLRPRTWEPALALLASHTTFDSSFEKVRDSLL